MTSPKGGRPPIPGGTRVEVMIPADLLARIDEVRDEQTRSAWIREACRLRVEAVEWVAAFTAPWGAWRT